MDLTSYSIVICSEQMTLELQERLYKLCQKRNGIFKETAFLISVTYLNFDFVTELKLLLEEENIDYTITLSKKIEEYKSSLPIKITDNTASVRNINYIRPKQNNQ